MFSTPAMNDTFSRTVTALVSCHLLPRRSTDTLTRVRYLSSCSSGGGTRLRHSSTTRSFAFKPDDFSFSRCRRTLSVCADKVFCHFSRRSGKARLSRRSKTVRRSKGGKTSQSSWYELLFEKEAFRASIAGLGGDEERFGVLTPGGGESPVDEVAEPFVRVLAISGARPSLWGDECDGTVGWPVGSDMVRMWSRKAATSGCFD